MYTPSSNNKKNNKKIATKVHSSGSINNYREDVIYGINKNNNKKKRSTPCAPVGEAPPRVIASFHTKR